MRAFGKAQDNSSRKHEKVKPRNDGSCFVVSDIRSVNRPVCPSFFAGLRSRRQVRKGFFAKKIFLAFFAIFRLLNPDLWLL